MIQNQLYKYTEAMSDFINYVLTAIGSTSYVEPPANASKTFFIFSCLKK